MTKFLIASARRSPAPVSTLTDIGQNYYTHARKILEELETADRTAGELKGQLRGVLRVSLPVAFGRLHVAPALPALLRQHPGLRLNVDLTDAPEGLVEGRIDAAIRLGALSTSSLIARKVGPHHQMICASPSYLEKCGSPQTPQDLLQHNCLLPGSRDHEASWLFTQGAHQETVRVTGNLCADSPEVLQEAAEGGVGLMLAPTWLVAQHIAAGQLGPVLGNWTASDMAEEGAIWAVYLPSRKGSLKVSAFIDALMRQFGGPPYWDRHLLQGGHPATCEAAFRIE